MAESSFPVLEQPLTDQQWGQVIEGLGSGILARRSEPYGIPSGGFDNAANTFRIAGRSPVTGDGRAVVSGFLHRYDANEVFTCPAVSATTTYYFGLTYDPTKHADSGGPVSLTITTSRPSGSGKVYLPIYRITRRANELLSDATVVDERAFVAPQITVKGAAALPPADSVLSYTVATDWETGQQWQMQLNGSWKAMGARTVAIPNNAGWSRSGSGVIITPLSDGTSKYELEVEMTRTGNSYNQGTGYTNNGTLIPPAARGDRGIVYVPAQIDAQAGWAAINTTTGQLLTRLASGLTTVYSGARITFSAMWVA